MKTRIPPVLITLALICFALVQNTKAVVPPPDGCYPGFTTAEGCDALNFVTTGVGNTGVGWRSLFLDTTGSFNTGVGGGALALNNADSNTAMGAAALLLNTSGIGNTAVGTNALVYNDNGGGNTANGVFALLSNTTGSFNVAIGWDALPNNDNGSGNVAIGEESLVNNISGGDNTVLGAGAGANIQAGSNNVYIGSGVDANGPFDESDTIRIGKSGTQTRTFVQGISGATVPGGVGVIVGTNGQLGTVVSSERFKEAVKPMDKTSEAILGLKPVTFRYKHELDPEGIPQFGLVAEDVEKVNPDLVARDDEGKPYTVRYDAVNAMLLNEFLKEHHQMQDLKAIVAEQQKQIEALTTGLQKVSAQLEASKPAPQVVNK